MGSGPVRMSGTKLCVYILTVVRLMVIRVDLKFFELLGWVGVFSPNHFWSKRRHHYYWCHTVFVIVGAANVVAVVDVVLFFSQQKMIRFYSPHFRFTKMFLPLFLNPGKCDNSRCTMDFSLLHSGQFCVCIRSRVPSYSAVSHCVDVPSVWL